MKKYLVIFAFALFVAVPTMVQAGTASQSFWDKLMALVGQTDTAQQTAATVVSQKAVSVKSTTVIPIEGTTAAAVASAEVARQGRSTGSGCGQTMTPVGTVNQTIRCDGTNWVWAENLLNDGVNASVGELDPSTRFNVQAKEANNVAISGKNFFQDGRGVEGSSTGEDGVGVYGVSTGDYSIGVHGVGVGEGVRGESEDVSGVGVYGGSPFGTGVAGKSPSGIAVSAVANTGFGFYQYGPAAKNFFAGSVGIGSSISSSKLNVLADDDDRSAILGRTNIEGRVGVSGEADAETSTAVEGIANAINSVAISGFANGPDSYGVLGRGLGDRSIGVLGSTNPNNGGIAVKAFPSGSGFGFYQEGVSSKNNLEGTLSVGYVNPGNLAPGVSAQISGGVRIFPNTGATRPACSNASNTRGTFWVSLGSAGSADSVEVCLRNSDGTYSWRNVF